VIVCHCKGISDREIRRAIRNGANSTREIAQACEASRGCGGCRPVLAEILESETEALCAPLHPLGSPVPAFSAAG
jgi:bacterioferritin-associated ferredoxin